MMLKFKLFSAFLFISVILIGCGINNDSQSSSNEITDWKPTSYQTVNDLEGVRMIAKEGTVSSTGLTVIFENDSDKDYTYGQHYLLEKKIAGDWYEVPIALDGNYGFDDIGYNIPPSQTSEWAVDWEWLYGSLEAGEYRIVKDLLEVREPGDYDTYHLAAEFIID